MLHIAVTLHSNFLQLVTSSQTALVTRCSYTLVLCNMSIPTLRFCYSENIFSLALVKTSLKFWRYCEETFKEISEKYLSNFTISEKLWKNFGKLWSNFKENVGKIVRIKSSDKTRTNFFRNMGECISYTSF